MVTHKCNKEQEIGIMVAEIKSLTKGQDRIEGKLDEFIKSADKKYATNDKVTALEQRFEAWNNRQDATLQSRSSFLKDLIIKLSPWIAVGLIWAFTTFGPGGA